MKIKMKIQITGTRDGVSWPAPGGEVELPDREAAKLVDAGFAVAVVTKGDDIEKRGPGRPRKTPE
jgi:hypothetical protein